MVAQDDPMGSLLAIGSEALEALRHRLEGLSRPTAGADRAAASEAGQRLAQRLPAELLSLLRSGWEVLEPVRVGPLETLLDRQEELAGEQPLPVGLTLVGQQSDGTPFGFLAGGETVVRLVDGEVCDTEQGPLAWLEAELEAARPRLWRWALERIGARGPCRPVSERELVELERRAGVPLPEQLRRFLGEPGRVEWPLTITGADELPLPDRTPEGVLWFGSRDDVLFGFSPEQEGEDLVVSFDPGDELDSLFVEDSFGWWLIGEVSIAEQAEQQPSGDALAAKLLGDDGLEDDGLEDGGLADDVLGEKLAQVLGDLGGKLGGADRGGHALDDLGGDDLGGDDLGGDDLGGDDLGGDDLGGDDLGGGDLGGGDLGGDALASRLLASFGLGDAEPGEDPLDGDAVDDGPGGPVGELLQALVERSWLELETPRSITKLALRVEAMLEREGPLALHDLDEWLLDQDEVVELYCDREQLLGLARELATG